MNAGPGPNQPRDRGRDRARRDLLIIHNPAAGHGRRRRFGRVLRRLRDLGCRYEISRTGAAGDAEALAAHAKADGHRLVVAAGGDGTINEAINGLAGSGVPLALLPLGTANVLAAEIGLALDSDAIAETIARGAPWRVNLGRVTSSSGAGRYFSLMAGVGFDAHVVADVELSLKRVIGRGAYVVESLRQLAVFPFPRYRVTLDGVAHEAASVIVAKARHYGGRYVCAPDAALDAPCFHVCLFARGGRLATVRYAVALGMGRLADLPDYRIVTASRVRIEGPAGDPVQGDGDIVAALPLEVEMVPGALQLVMPG